MLADARSDDGTSVGTEAPEGTVAELADPCADDFSADEGVEAGDDFGADNDLGARDGSLTKASAAVSMAAAEGDSGPEVTGSG